MLKRVLKFAKGYGVKAAFWQAFTRVYTSFIPPVRQIYCANLADFQIAPGSEAPLVRVQFFQSLGDIPAAIVDELLLRGTLDDRKPYSRTMIIAYLDWLFSRGAVFWACFEGQNLIGYLWSIRGAREYPRFHFFPLGSRDAISLAHEVFPPYRGRGLNREMTSLVLRELKAVGVERVYIDVLVSNERSLRSFSKTTFVPVGQARMKNFRKRQIVIWRQRGFSSFLSDPHERKNP
jgi:RimJ/RimL family protein N-acetyltransferase